MQKNKKSETEVHSGGNICKALKQCRALIKVNHRPKLFLFEQNFFKRHTRVFRVNRVQNYYIFLNYANKSSFFCHFSCICQKKAVPLHSELSTEDHNLRVGTGRESGFFMPLCCTVCSQSRAYLPYLPYSSQSQYTSAPPMCRPHDQAPC